MNPYWISFVAHETNLGCCIVYADSPVQAIEKTNQLGINPGGEAMIGLLEKNAIDLMLWEKNKLISKEELEASGYEKLGEDGKELLLQNNVSIICKNCNQ